MVKGTLRSRCLRWLSEDPTVRFRKKAVELNRRTQERTEDELFELARAGTCDSPRQVTLAGSRFQHELSNRLSLCFLRCLLFKATAGLRGIEGLPFVALFEETPDIELRAALGFIFPDRGLDIAQPDLMNRLCFRWHNVPFV